MIAHVDAREARADADTAPEKKRAFEEIYWWLRLIDEARLTIESQGANQAAQA